MAVSLYAASVPVFVRMLNNLSAVLDKAQAHAAERGFDSAVLVSARLAPDMHPLSFQVQNATDRAKFFVARVTGQTPPSWPDEERTIAELQARIRTAIDYLGTYSAQMVEANAERVLPVRQLGKQIELAAPDYLLFNVLPNFFFHVTTA